MIKDHLLSLLQGDKRLYAGGGDYPAGWAGVKRVDKMPTDPTQAPLPGWVNIFDETYERDGGPHRPAIYVGNRAVAATNRRKYPTLTGPTHGQTMLLTLPLILVCQGTAKNTVSQQLAQLLDNVRSILLSHPIENGYWYLLEILGSPSGGVDERTHMSATAQAKQGIAEAYATLPVLISYNWKPRAPIP